MQYGRLDLDCLKNSYAPSLQLGYRFCLVLGFNQKKVSFAPFASLRRKLICLY